MISEQKFWNPVIETLDHEKIRQLQLKKFKKIFSWAYERSRFHRGLYEKAGIKPEDIRSFEDIRRVPTVEKSMMRRNSAQRALPIRRRPLRTHRRCVGIPADKRHHRPTSLSGRHMAGLGMVGRELVIHPLGPGLSPERPRISSFRI